MINPRHTSISELFRDECVFVIPKYQRNYAWTEDELSDFKADITKCYVARSQGTPYSHFFGGVVTVESSVAGTARKQHDVIDGQQRICTFVMLIACITAAYAELLVTVDSNDQANRRLLQQRIDALTRKYIEYNDEVNRQIIVVSRLEMSKADMSFFKRLIRGLERDRRDFDRESHSRLHQAYYSLNNLVKTEVARSTNIVEQLDSLKRYEEILNDDFTLIDIVTDSKKEAYRLFQVLNDRGMGLTEGDLLRSRTLEMLENVAYQNQQQSVEEAWDNILADHPTETEKFLRWYFASVIGDRPGKLTLFDDFIKEFFSPSSSNSNPANLSNNLDVVVSSVVDADYISNNVDRLLREIQVCRTLIEGAWPFPSGSSAWYQERLIMLINVLQHTNCMPLLLAAATQLDSRRFSEIVILTERFVFRYKTICNQHISPLTNIYVEQALEIRANPTSYQVSRYKQALANLQQRSAGASDQVFKSNLEQFTYSQRQSNKTLKYLLITLEHYARWYSMGASGEPQCIDVNRILDFTSTSIEHVYPQNAQIPDPALEPVINNLGNLTILVPADNQAAGNKSFSVKTQILQQSPVQLNKDIANFSAWDRATVDLRQNQLIDQTIKVFTVV